MFKSNQDGNSFRALFLKERRVIGKKIAYVISGVSATVAVIALFVR